MTNCRREKHLEYIDILRTIAIIAVIVQHAASYYIGGCYGDIHVANMFRGVTRWNVLLFVSITGVLLLGRNIQIKIMWGKYIFRIGRVFLVWSTLYSMYACIIDTQYTGGIEMIKVFISNIAYGGTVRMWYLVMLFALYLVIPIINTWIKSVDEKEYKYTLCVLYVARFLH